MEDYKPKDGTAAEPVQKTEQTDVQARCEADDTAPDQYSADLLAMEKGRDMPRRLETATASLVELAREETDSFTDAFTNDGAANFEAVRAAFRLCRAALDEAEKWANIEAATATRYHAENLANWQNVGVLPREK